MGHTRCAPRLHPGLLFPEASGPNPRMLRAPWADTGAPNPPAQPRCPGLPARPYLVIGDVGARVGRRDGGGGGGREGSPEQGRAEPGAAHHRPQHAELSWAGPGPAARDSPAPPPARPGPARHRSAPPTSARGCSHRHGASTIGSACSVPME